MIKLTDLLNESSPGFENRKTGDALPTLDSVRAAYQAKKGITEAEDDKYVSIGFGRYKQKGKEDDDNAPTFKKDDSGKYVPTSDKAAKGGDSSAEKDTPKVNIFDKPKKDKKSEPKKDTPKRKWIAYDKDHSMDSNSGLIVPKGKESDNPDAKDVKGFDRLDEPKSDSSEKAPRDEKNRIVVPKELGLKGDRFNDDWYQQTFAWVTTKEEQKVINDLIKKSSPQVVDKIATRGLSGSQIRDGEHSQKFIDTIKKHIEKKKDTPKKDEPKDDGRPKDSTGGRAGNPEVNKSVRKKAQSLGITAKKLGKEEYESRMSKAAIEALTDSNFHSEARKLIAVLEDKPEWANDPNQDPNKPDIFTPEYEEWQKTSVYSSELYDSAEGTDEIAHEASNQAGWDGVAALDAIAFDLKMNGSKQLAAKIQGIIDDTNESTMRLTKMEYTK